MFTSDPTEMTVLAMDAEIEELNEAMRKGGTGDFIAIVRARLHLLVTNKRGRERIATHRATIERQAAGRQQGQKAVEQRWNALSPYDQYQLRSNGQAARSRNKTEDFNALTPAEKNRLMRKASEELYGA